MSNVNTRKYRNKGSIPRIILSNYDSHNIREIKVRYEKAARLDKIEILEMNCDKENNILFSKIKLNGQEYSLPDTSHKEIEIKEGDQHHYIITAHKQESNTWVLLLQDKDSKKIWKKRVTKQDGKYYKNGEIFEWGDDVECLQASKKNDKFVVSIHDIAKDRYSMVEGDILDFSVNVYNRILTKDDYTSLDIYKIKRYLAFRSKFSFFYMFVDGFFNTLARNSFSQYAKTEMRMTADSIVTSKHKKTKSKKYKKNMKVPDSIKTEKKVNEYENTEIYKIDISNNFLNHFKEMLNDSLINEGGILHEYHNSEDLKNDLENIKLVFKKIRMALAHYDYDFFDRLFAHEIDEKNLPVKDIKLLNILLENSEELNVTPKQNYIEDDDKITLLDAKGIKLKRLYTYYIKLNTKYPGLNNLVNSFFAKDGIETELKDYINDKASTEDSTSYVKLGNTAYHMDIAQFREYKDIYNAHKERVTKKAKEEAKEQADGKRINDLNTEINEKKLEMKAITKLNSIKRLEYKLRVAFGFALKRYDTLDRFKNDFENDLVNEKFSEIGMDEIKGYLDVSYDKSKKFFKNNDKNYIFEDLNFVLSEIVGTDDAYLKTFFLFGLFLPKELRGDFVGFVRHYYHKTKSILADSNDQDNLNNKIPESTKIRIFEQNIKKIHLLKYNLDSQSEIDEKIYNAIGVRKITNKENLSKYFYSILFRYYTNLYKLLNDYEIYLLSKIDTDKKLSDIIKDNGELAQNGYYNFRRLLFKSNISEKDDVYHTLANTRNNINHQNIDDLLRHFIYTEEALIPNINKKHAELYETWLRRDISDITAEKINQINTHKDIKKVLGFNSVNDFRQRLKQSITKLSASSEKIKEKIGEINEKTSKISKNIKRENNDEKREELIKYKNGLEKERDHLFSLQRLNYFFIEKFKGVVDKIS